MRTALVISWPFASPSLPAARPNAHRQLIVGMELAYPPFEMTDQRRANPPGSASIWRSDLGNHLGREVEIAKHPVSTD